MKILYSWLMDFIDADLSAEEAAEKFIGIGFNVEDIQKTGASFKGVVIGEILKIEKHPNADKLSLCEVSAGADNYNVVCGAQNIAVGQKIPFAPVGAELCGQKLKKAKIRGVESSGMICSAGELGVEGNNGGILVLPENTPVGVDAKTLFEKEDYILDFEMLPNQSYCLSHMTLARELCSFHNLPFKPLKANKFETDGKKSFPVENESPEHCPRYSAIVIKNVSAVKTPDWIKKRLRAMDVNPKDNLLIDVSNYIMFEMGQPTHCFDLDKLSGGRIKVRFSKPGEILNTLEGADLKVKEDYLVIADSEKPVALAGIIGGTETSVSQATKNILIESANFLPSLIKKTSKKTTIKTESSNRFERGADIENTMSAAKRIADIITDACPKASIEAFNDNYPSKYRPKIIEATPEKINSILGTDISEENIFNSLKAVQPDIKADKPWQFAVPSHRTDICGVCDLAEETGRFMGYDIIPSKSEMKMMKASATSAFEIISDLRNKFSGIGFSEVYNYDFISEKEINNYSLNKDECVEIKNPLSIDYQFLRNSLICGLLKTLKYNLNRQAESVSIFETGNVYARHKDGHKEETLFAGLMYGEISGERFWKGAKENADFHHIKGALSRAIGDIENLKFIKASSVPGFMHSGNSLSILLRGKKIGFVGQLNPKTAAASGFKSNNIWYFEFSLVDLILIHKKDFHLNIKQIKPVSDFPIMWRDLSIVLDNKYEWADIEKTVSKIKNLINIELTDIYKGKNIGDNLKSVTIRFTFSSMEKTLTDEEVSGYMSDILAKLAKNFSAKLRA